MIRIGGMIRIDGPGRPSYTYWEHRTRIGSIVHVLGAEPRLDRELQDSWDAACFKASAPAFCFRLCRKGLPAVLMRPEKLADSSSLFTFFTRTRNTKGAYLGLRQMGRGALSVGKSIKFVVVL